MKADDASGVLLVTASAGSGKTTRLTRAVTEALDPEGPAAIDVPGLVAVTYTTKAQSELESRLRRALVGRGQFARAEELPLARVGTVHAVCLRLLQDFALEAGLSPAVDGLPQQAARLLLQQALEQSLPLDLRQRVERLAAALELNWDHRTSANDWITPVEQIMTLARNNRIVPESLAAMGERSAQGLLALLGPPLADAASLERELLEEVTRALEALTAANDGQKNTAGAIETLQSSVRELDRGGLKWTSWCKLAKLAPGKSLLPLVDAVQRVAAQYEIHPTFQAQIHELCALLFEAARLGLAAYAEFKAERGLVDYVDMIDLALRALEVPDVEVELRQQVALVVVDEFQDTSPLQLALFAKLHQFCGRALWVGDRKQCIFEYAGADPTLMEAVSDWVKERGGQTEVLDQNYRSRPELVRPTSLLFAKVFAEHGHTAAEVLTEPARASLPELGNLPAFGVWWLDQRRGEDQAIAEGVYRLLESSADTPVLDRQSGEVRPLRAGDVAVLVATNAEAAKLAAALALRGVACVLPRTGLMQRPEATLLSAALRYLIDARDTLARAEVEALLGFGGLDQGAWFGRWLAEVGRGKEECDRHTPCPELERLDALRAAMGRLSPSEVVQQVIADLRLPELTQRWPEPSQSLGNLDALMTLVQAYEDRALYLREAASLPGLLRYFDESQIAVKQQDEERATDEQFALGSETAVTLITYHKSKGLEWPVVVLGSLDRDARRHAFEVMPESDTAQFDASDPLGSRFIRYWPWPLGQQKSVPLRDRAEESAVGQAVARRDRRERARLLYVGFTRARDHLVLAVPRDTKRNPRCAWLDELSDSQGPLLELPSSEAEHSQVVVDRESRVDARVWTLTGQACSRPQVVESERRWFASGEPRSDVPFFIQPSKGSASVPVVARVASQDCFTRRMPLNVPKTITWDAVGSAIHAFLAADDARLGVQEREQLARRVLVSAQLVGALQPEALLGASDALRKFVDARWPNAVWHREVPVEAQVSSTHGDRRIRGTIDLLLELPNGVIVIDHKSFPGRVEHWAEHALGHASQLLMYSAALEATGYAVTGHFIHFTVGGGMVEVELER